MSTTYTLSVVRISDGAIDRDGGLTPQYECVISAYRPAGICGPVADIDATDNFAAWADAEGFDLVGFPEITTRYDGLAVAVYPAVAR